MGIKGKVEIEDTEDADRPRMDSVIAKVVASLEILSRSDTPVGVSAVARALDLDKSNVHRIFNTLLDLGYVQKDDDTGRYSATLKLWEQGSAIIARHPIKRAGQPILRILRQQTNESPYLSMLHDLEVLYLDRLDSPYPLVAQVSVGRRAPAYKTASGKAMLAFQPDPPALLNQLPAAVRDSLDVPALLEEFAHIRKRGFAVSTNAAVAGMTAVAAPVQRRSGAPYIAVGVGGLSDRFGDEYIEEMGRAVLNAAVNISEIVGDA
ncbi:IclR family transcriptional regulator [Ottowia thiooxydans]|uniref:IclR family transcriptional regulator n=1 Tax=Ottowia thiooxydans TaxID=219182 RepID=UPI0004271983|nr:IclR family transcriptional regulator [Ottowia thiooxydans]